MEDFKKYMEDFKSLEKNTKKAIIYNQLEILDSVMHDLCLNSGSENKKLSDYFLKDDSEMEYLDSLVVLINSIQNSLGDYNYNITEILEKAQQKNTI